VSAGRTSWWPCDAAEHDREANVELGDEFGAVGPLTMRVLKDLAQAQGGQKNVNGIVRTGFRSLSRKTFATTIAEQRAVIEFAGNNGALDDLVIDDDGRRFTARISGWKDDQARGRETIRKAAGRAAQADRDQSGPAGTDPAPEGPVPAERDNAPAMSQRNGTAPPAVPAPRDVSGSVPLTREDQTEEELPPLPPQGGRDRDRVAFEDQMAAWTQRYFPGADPGLVTSLATRLRTRGVMPSAENMRRFSDRHPQWQLAVEPAATESPRSPALAASSTSPAADTATTTREEIPSP
jgi:hypothetical protein